MNAEQQLDRKSRNVAGYAVLLLLVLLALFATAQMMDAQEQHMRAELIIASSPNAIVACGEDMRIVDSNFRSERLFGWTREELIGQTAEVLMPEGSRQAHRDGMQNALEYARSELIPGWYLRQVVHVRGIHRDGNTLLDLEATILVVKLKSGRIEFLTYFRELEEPAGEVLEPLPDVMKQSARPSLAGPETLAGVSLR